MPTSGQLEQIRLIFPNPSVAFAQLKIIPRIFKVFRVQLRGWGRLNVFVLTVQMLASFVSRRFIIQAYLTEMPS